jgi:hypothetical protein
MGISLDIEYLGQAFIVDVESSDPIYAVKEKILTQSISGIHDIQKIQLFYQNSLLNDTDILSDLNIGRDSTLIMTYISNQSKQIDWVLIAFFVIFLYFLVNMF